MKRQKCPCCVFYTVDSEDEVIVNICDVLVRDPIEEELPEKNMG